MSIYSRSYKRDDLRDGGPGVSFDALKGVLGADVVCFRGLMTRRTLWEWSRSFGQKHTSPQPPGQRRARAAEEKTGRFKVNFKSTAKPGVSAADADLRAEVEAHPRPNQRPAGVNRLFNGLVPCGDREGNLATIP